MAAMMAFALASGARAESARDAFVELYHCPVTRLVEAIHQSGDPKKENNRYIILNPGGAEQDYVQCAFFDSDRKMHCEAASYFYWKSPRPYLPQASIAALAKLGFSTDGSHGNYVRELASGEEGQRARIVDMLLDALYDAYGMRSSERLAVQAPMLFARERYVRKSRCAPIA